MPAAPGSVTNVTPEEVPNMATVVEAIPTDAERRSVLIRPQARGRTRWLRGQDAGNLPLGYLGVGTGASTALAAAADSGLAVRAIVSLGGWLDLVGPRLAQVQAATLLVVGGVDAHVLELNRAALKRFGPCEHELVVVPGATHNFEQ